MAFNLAHPYNRRKSLVAHWHHLSPTAGCDVGQVVTIDGLPDDDLLAIFDFCVFKYEDLDLRVPSDSDTKRKIQSWQSLVHVCRRWRGLVFVSQRRLNLQLFCVTRAGGSARKSSLDVWPALPLVIQGHVYDSSVDNVIALLEHSDRIYQSTSIAIQLRKFKNFGQQFRSHSRSSQFCACHLEAQRPDCGRTEACRTSQFFQIHSWVDLCHVCDSSP